MFPFLKFAPDLLMNKFAMPRALAGDVTSYLMYGTILLTPLFGWITDNKGKSATLMYLGSALLIIAHLMFAKTYIEPRVPIVLLGIAFSLVPAAMWPAVTKIVRQSKLGTAYGFMFSVQNIGLWIFPIVIGWVIDSSNPFYRAEISSAQFAAVQQDDMRYQGTYLDRHQEAIKDMTLHVNASVFADSISGDIVWREVHHTKTDSQGQFELQIGEGDVVSLADFSFLVDGPEYKARIIVTRRSEDIMIYDGGFAVDGEGYFTEAAGAEHATLFGNTMRGRIKVYDATPAEADMPDHDVPNTEDRQIWQERIRFYLEDDGSFEIPMGYGRLVHANANYFGIREGDFEMEVIKPLDYTNAMLVFSLLGFVGFVFAFLLKREDKTSGYGLERPNKED